MKKVLIFLMLLSSLSSWAKKPKDYFFVISTNQGDIFLRLYNQTPQHRDNFVHLIKEEKLNGTLFHRVIKEFMIQGGDPDSKNAAAGQLLGEGDLGYKVAAEFNDSLFHKRGALAAARDNNPEKSSSACQFYIVQGKKFTDMELDRIEQSRLRRKIPDSQRAVYKTLGGAPFLDQSYTVFGQVVKGMDVVDQIASAERDVNDRPKDDVKMEVRLMKKRAVRKLLKEQAKKEA